MNTLKVKVSKHIFTSKYSVSIEHEATCLCPPVACMEVDAPQCANRWRDRTFKTWAEVQAFVSGLRVTNILVIDNQSLREW